MSIGDRIRKERKRIGKSQKELASAIGAKQTTVSSWENNARQPGRDQVKKLAEILEISPLLLEFGEDAAELYEHETFDTDQDERRISSDDHMVKLVGYVGGQVGFIPFHDSRADVVLAPPNAPPGTEAVELWGDSMAPFYPEGSILYYEKASQEVARYIGKAVICVLEDGVMTFKILKRGSMPGLYNLQSAHGVEQENVAVISVFPLIWTRTA